jgi:hypothetical protein
MASRMGLRRRLVQKCPDDACSLDAAVIVSAPLQFRPANVSGSARCRTCKFLLYLSSVKTEYAQGASIEPSPHIIFGNATSDEALIEFVRRFGPVIATKVLAVQLPRSGELSPRKIRVASGYNFSKSSAPSPEIGWLRDLIILRREQRTSAAALGLLAERRRGDLASITAIRQHMSDIVDGVSFWPGQCEAERHLRISARRHTPPLWHFDFDRLKFIWNLNADAFGI